MGDDLKKYVVASFTDAWIETFLSSCGTDKRSVASFTDAWIETLYSDEQREKLKVASFTDAWIETMIINILYYIQSSHLLQMRGLKQTVGKNLDVSIQSHLLQMRGLKPPPEL